ncbi:MAG: haloalkane dehalogenase [Frankiales bacterium]|nr:haloalkane dehalogenase [Frankiales bacterium]
MDALRTPDERFTDLPGYPWEPAYVPTSDGLRMAVLDEGPRDAPVVLLLHGEPTWSYLYRKMVPPLLEAGLRVVAPDLVGFGRSDKPREVSDHTYARHVEWVRSALFGSSSDGGLDLRDVVLFCQDWGGLIGLRLVGEHPDRFRAVCASNTGLPDGSAAMGPEWQQFRAFVDATPDLPVGFLVTSGCLQGLSEPEAAAYDAPFPDASYKAGPRAFPGLIPQSADDPAAPAQQAAWRSLEQFRKPFLCAFSDGDPITAGADRVLLGRVPGTQDQPHTVVAGASHFVQEDRGPELAQVLVDWVRGL